MLTGAMLLQSGPAGWHLCGQMHDGHTSLTDEYKLNTGIFWQCTCMRQWRECCQPAR